ncbi:MAG: hypothetical protein HOM27_01685, partial [Candidatus Marinimicrobia bacterium]|nr:hypothetical protein [Candidatus Neomarinimicrobiota bacterium]
SSMGKALASLTTHYDNLTGTRLRALEKPMQKIKELELGDHKEIKEIE